MADVYSQVASTLYVPAICSELQHGDIIPGTSLDATDRKTSHTVQLHKLNFD